MHVTLTEDPYFIGWTGFRPKIVGGKNPRIEDIENALLVDF